MPKLYELKQRNVFVRLLEDSDVPPVHEDMKKGKIVKFSHIDGMYSLCYDEEGNPVHPAAWTECEIL